MPARTHDEIELIRDDLRRWSRVWNTPEVAERVGLRTSTRFKTTLGRFQPQRFEITLASWLLDAPEPLKQEVAAHEAAHAAVHLLHGHGARPHGAEWRALMEAVSIPARVHIPHSDLPAARRQALAAQPRWEHRCPVCQASRVAKTRVTRWRCARCRQDGLSGELVIERVADALRGDR